jgi:hypothetical protein
MASAAGVTLYDRLYEPGPLAGPQLALPVRVALTVNVNVRTVVASLSVPVLPVAWGPTTWMLQTPVTISEQSKPVSRLIPTDVAAPLAISVMKPVQVTVAIRMPPTVHVPWKLIVTESEEDAGLLVVPTIVLVLQIDDTAEYVKDGLDAVPDTAVPVGVMVTAWAFVALTQTEISAIASSSRPGLENAFMVRGLSRRLVQGRRLRETDIAGTSAQPPHDPHPPSTRDRRGERRSMIRS